ncbi:MAG: hypothetical protein LBB89_11800 [Treponema sp.]|jgi:putative selenate reductase|nr:hypothetical protein [Treponema sp.]
MASSQFPQKEQNSTKFSPFPSFSRLPHAGKPYKDKLTVFSCEEDFSESENAGFLKIGVDTYKIRLENKSVVTFHMGGKSIPDTWITVLDAVMSNYEYLFM